MFGFSAYSQVTYSDIPPSPDAVVSVTGASATGVLGTVIIPNETVNLTGVSATAVLGTITVTVFADASATLTGLVATGEVGSPIIWSPVDDAQSATWTSIIN